MLLSVLKIYLIHNHIITRGTWNSMQVEAPQLFLVKQAFVNEPQPRRRHFLGRRVRHPAVLPKHDQLLVQRGAAGLHEADEFARGPAGDGVGVGTQRDLFGPPVSGARERQVTGHREMCEGRRRAAGRQAGARTGLAMRPSHQPRYKMSVFMAGSSAWEEHAAQHKERSQTPWTGRDVR